ncbi:MAG: alpha/beta fold hydrolase [Patescibacteria group bacterium]
MANNNQLAAMIIRPEGFSGKRPVVLAIHGWTSEMARYPERIAPLIEMGWIGVLFDMRGHGETGGKLKTLSVKDHHEDCLAAYDYIKNIEYADTENIAVFGSSYGGYQACLLAAKRPVKHLILKAPAQYGDVLFEIPDKQRSTETTEYRLHHHTPQDNQALRAINNFKGNILFIECEKDEQVPKQVINDYRSATTKNYDYELLAGADHSCHNPGSNQAMLDVMAGWFRKLGSK